MPKELLELLDQINDKKEEVRKLVSENKIEEAKKAKGELKELQDKFDLMKDLDDSGKKPDNKTPAEPKDAMHEFAQAARRGFRVENAMKEGVPADGGYTVPEDVQTKINKYRDSKFSLLQLVRHETVKTEKGSRTFKKRSQQTGFQKVAEGGKIGAKNTPQFERLKYEIEKYGGYFPLTNELLADTDANLAGTLIEWIGDESRVTANKVILEKINTKATVKVDGLKGIKKALNVTLGSAFKSSSKIVTNDSGLQYLDTLEDKVGRPLLTPSSVDAMKMRIAVGGTYVPVEVIPNDDLPDKVTYTKTTDADVQKDKTYYTLSGEEYAEVEEPKKADIATYYEATETRTPVIIGDLEEGIWFFDRNKTSIMTSNVAAIGDLNAFEEDLTIYRAIEREDVQVRDERAFVNGYIVA